MNTPWDIYAKELFPLGYGHPMWGPEPSFESGEVQLGDIGYLREGRFCFLCNSLKPAEAAVHSELGVPEDFQVFDPPNLMRRHRLCEITQRQLHSKNLQSTTIAASVSAGNTAGVVNASAGVRYRCLEESGALLMLKHAGHKTYIDCPLHIKKYMKKNMAGWSHFANAHLGIGVEDKDIIFVSGFIKTPAWGEAAFTHCSTGGELLVSGGCFMLPASGEFHVSLDKCAEPSVFCRSGPPDRVSVSTTGKAPATDVAQRKDDQCIFINYYKMRSRTPWGMGMQAAAGPHELPPAPDDDSTRPLARRRSHAVSDASNTVSVGGMSTYGATQSYDPVNEILEYILENSDAAVAFASDMDVAALIQYLKTPEEVSHVLETRPPKIDVDEDGVGTIDPSSDASLPDQPEADNGDVAFSEGLHSSRKGGPDTASTVPGDGSVNSPDQDSHSTMSSLSLVRKVTMTLTRQSALVAFKVKGKLERRRRMREARKLEKKGGISDQAQALPVMKQSEDVKMR